MIKPQLDTSLWLSLPADTRAKLKAAFNIAKSSFSHVSDNKVITDGHTYQDLSVVNVESLQNFLGVKEKDFFNLFNLALQKLETPEVVEAPVQVVPEIKEEKKKKKLLM